MRIQIQDKLVSVPNILIGVKCSLFVDCTFQQNDELSGTDYSCIVKFLATAILQQFHFFGR